MGHQRGTTSELHISFLGAARAGPRRAPPHALRRGKRSAGPGRPESRPTVGPEPFPEAGTARACDQAGAIPVGPVVAVADRWDSEKKPTLTRFMVPLTLRRRGSRPSRCSVPSYSTVGRILGTGATRRGAGSC